MPQLDHWLDKNPVRRIGPPSFGAVVNLSVGRLVGRLQGTDGYDPSHKDFLAHFIEKKDQLDWVNDQQVIGWILVNVCLAPPAFFLLLIYIVDARRC